MTKRKENSSPIIGALVVLCVLCSLYFSAAAPDSALSLDRGRQKAASALRCLPVYSYLGTSEVDESFLIDTTHGGEGYFAVTARSDQPVRARITAPGGAERIYNVPNTGLVAYYPLSDGNGSYGIQLLRRIPGESEENRYERVLEGSCDAALFDEFQPFLRPSTYVWFTGYSECVSEAARLCAGVSDDNKKVDRIKGFVAEKLSYDESLTEKEDQSFIRDPDVILRRQSGICLDYAVLTAAMLRSQGIPAKVVYGSMSGVEGLHAWNMVYTSSRGWFRLDVTSVDNGILESYIADDANFEDTGWY